MSLRVPVGLYQYQGSEIVTEPAIEPVTLEEMRQHLRIDDEDEHEYLLDIIREAREEIEQASGLSLISQTWRLAIDRWPAGKQEWWDGVRQGHINQIYGPESYSALALPKYPLLSVDSVKVYDEDSNETDVVIADTFDIDTIQRPGRMTLKVGATWPIALRSNNAIIIEYTTGYGTAATDVPSPLRRAVKALAAYLFNHRGDGCDPIEAMKMSGAATVVNRYRTQRI
jgi:uncharacterized phiE125 gp8 family phage protein